ncbi:Eco57I restriction-modification methylase domain-containing protein [Rothia sp. HC945]|uniref:Eco57I restriction-modification methylase domain-containing protein n=1 Tax=Rothia sp. HC945 TaxID=3171170 RepID=UPI003F2008AE
MIENLDVVDGLIVGRVRPHIYAFSTNTVPNFLKVGDTYRPVRRRLQEWRKHYPDLQQHFEGSASVADDVYFRDHSVHQFLSQERGLSRIERDALAPDVYYSTEFFESASSEDVELAIKDIHRDHQDNGGRYVFFDASERLRKTFRFARGAEWVPRPNQQAALDSFAAAVDAGRTNLLMYAVMRFGKTFTSLLCAKRMQAETVLVVSAKADVKGEWKQTVESAGNFAGNVFLDADDLLADEDAISTARAENDCVVVFLTLQDLQGEELKEKHEEVFSSEIDLLIVDETHFGARAEKYGAVLREANQPVEKEAAIVQTEDDRVELADAQDKLKVLNAKIRLHLSGSPYRILMGGEFEPEDIIAFVQFADIVREQELWDQGNPDEDEWKNPYFGFPQMIRFAFNPNASSRRKLEALKKNGDTYAFTALLKPESLTADRKSGAHKRFEHESEILDLLRVIDGSQEDENLLGFLDYDKIKQGGMCRHLVMVLPYRASCDAMQTLVEQNASSFKNLDEYEIINISGVDSTKKYPNPQHVKQAIARADGEGRKTLTLTVNRMLTGSTVEQWDTMLYLKDTASPQEYDQATFRLQSQHVRELATPDGAEVIKENLKPQTLLVDFDPARLFQMQELRSLMSNVNSEETGNARLVERLHEDLRISPVVTINSNRLAEVEPTNILDAVREYNLRRSIEDEARDVPVDLGLLDNDLIRQVIEQQAEIGSRGGMNINPFDGEEVDLDLDDESEGGDGGGDRPPRPPRGSRNDEDDVKSLAKKLQTYYQRILFFAMLTSAEVASLQDVIDIIDEGENVRIANNLELERSILDSIHKAFDPFKLNSLDYKIQNISHLAREERLTPIERAERALGKFTRISDAEVRTPLWLCQEMVRRIPAERLRALVERGEKLLDVSSKSGEFAFAFYQRLVEDLEVDPSVAQSVIYSVPTSGIAYEFTRRFYEVLGMNVENIATGFTTYDLNVDGGLGAVFDEGSGPVKFGVVVANPPYQVSDGGAQASARAIYPHFVNAALALGPEFMTFVIPSRWYTGGKQLGDFRDQMLSDPHIKELHDYPRPDEVFPDTNNRGGVCFFLRDTNYDANESGGTRVLTRGEGGIEFEATRPLNTFGLGIFLRDSKGMEIVQKVTQSEGFVSFQDQVSSRKPFGLEGNIVNAPEFRSSPSGMENPVRCFGKAKKVGYIDLEHVRARHDWIDRWKVFTPYANNIATELSDDNQNAFVVAPGTVCSETFLVMGGNLELTEETAGNLVAFLKTRFARFLHAKAKISQHGTKQTYRFVPQVDVSAESSIDWTVQTDEIDEQLFDLYGLTEDEREHVRLSIKPM